MRARNIKPGFYKNEDLAECSFEARLLFPGLWLMADREGRLEDRPKRIKGEIFPYDSVDVDTCLNELVKWGFIERYQVDDIRVISIKHFLGHQNPHVKERDSELPDQGGIYTVYERDTNGFAKRIKCYKKIDGNQADTKEQLKNCSGTIPEQCKNPLNPES